LCFAVMHRDVNRVLEEAVAAEESREFWSAVRLFNTALTIVKSRVQEFRAPRQLRKQASC